MKPQKLLKVLLPTGAGMGIGSMFIKFGIHEVTYYNAILMPALLLMSTVLGIKVALSYERELRRTFIFISMYLAVLCVGNLKIFWPQIYGWSLVYAPLLFDLAASTMLLLSCVYTLQVIEVRRMSRAEWVIFGIVFAIGIAVVSYAPLTQLPSGEISLEFWRSLAFRVLNVALVLTLLPVLFLYLHQFRGEARESITFGMIIVGIIVVTIADWIYELVAGIPHEMIGTLFQSGSPYDAFLIFSYFIIFSGLVVHVNYEKWTLEGLKQFKIE